MQVASVLTFDEIATIVKNRLISEDNKTEDQKDTVDNYLQFFLSEYKHFLILHGFIQPAPLPLFNQPPTNQNPNQQQKMPPQSNIVQQNNYIQVNMTE